jgi:hypothetical protein
MKMSVADPVFTPALYLRARGHLTFSYNARKSDQARGEDVTAVTARLTVNSRQLFIVAALVGALALGCTEDGEPSTDPTPGVVSGGAGAFPTYEHPVPLTEGDYFEAYISEVRLGPEAVQSVREAEKDLGVFEGEINGVRLYSSQHGLEDPAVAKKSPCAIHEARIVEDITFGYLPGGTSAGSPLFSAICEDGYVVFTSQSFFTKHGSFDIQYARGERALEHDAPSTRIEPATVRGQPAVIIRPPVDDIFGRSTVAVVVPEGMLLLDAFDLPLAETLKLLEGIKCDGC